MPEPTREIHLPQKRPLPNALIYLIIIAIVFGLPIMLNIITYPFKDHPILIDYKTIDDIVGAPLPATAQTVFEYEDHGRDYSSDIQMFIPEEAQATFAEQLKKTGYLPLELPLPTEPQVELNHLLDKYNLKTYYLKNALYLYRPDHQTTKGSRVHFILYDISTGFLYIYQANF